MIEIDEMKDLVSQAATLLVSSEAPVQVLNKYLAMPEEKLLQFQVLEHSFFLLSKNKSYALHRSIPNRARTIQGII